MFGDFRHRTHHWGDLIHTTIESTFLTSGALVVLLALLLFYAGLLAMKTR